MLVVGIVVLPDTAGNGATMTFDSYVRTNPMATQNVRLFAPGRGVADLRRRGGDSGLYSPPDSLPTPLQHSCPRAGDERPVPFPGVRLMPCW